MEKIKPRDKYKHFKGGIVKVDCLATDTDNHDRKLVIYHYIKNKDKNSKEKIWARSFDEFTGYKTPKIKRFAKIK